MQIFHFNLFVFNAHHINVRLYRKLTRCALYASLGDAIAIEFGCYLMTEKWERY